MANRYQTLENGKGKIIEATVSSTGASEAGDIVALDGTGKLDTSVLPAGIGADIKIAETSEDLSAGDYVNIYDDTGTVKVRLADNSNGREAHGFVLDAFLTGSNASVYFEGSNTAAASNAAGDRAYLGTAGGVLITALDPATNVGSIHQLLGTYVDATEINTDIDDCIVLQMVFKRLIHLNNGKLGVLNIWDLLLIMRRTFTASENIHVEADRTLLLASPKIDGELRVDGEAYIL